MKLKREEKRREREKAKLQCWFVSPRLGERENPKHKREKKEDEKKDVVFYIFWYLFEVRMNEHDMTPSFECTPDRHDRVWDFHSPFISHTQF